MSSPPAEKDTGAATSNTKVSEAETLTALDAVGQATDAAAAHTAAAETLMSLLTMTPAIRLGKKWAPIDLDHAAPAGQKGAPMVVNETSGWVGQLPLNRKRIFDMIPTTKHDPIELKAREERARERALIRTNVETGKIFHHKFNNVPDTKTTKIPVGSRGFMSKWRSSIPILTPVQEYFLKHNMNKGLQHIVNGKWLHLNDILWYVESFPFTYFSVDKKKSNSIVIPEDIFLSTSKFLKSVWETGKYGYCHVPIHDVRHFDGITVEIGKRNILFYDPKKRYGKAGKNIEGTIDVLQSESKWESLLSKLNGKNKWSTAQNKILKIYNVIEIIEQELHRAQHRKWTFRIVNEFLYQENDIDCGVFVCFFFACVSRKIKTKVENGCVCGYNLFDLRPWIAYSVLIAKNGKGGQLSFLQMDQKNDVVEIVDSGSDE